MLMILAVMIIIMNSVEDAAVVAVFNGDYDGD
jgi:hypothetical protein